MFFDSFFREKFSNKWVKVIVQYFCLGLLITFVLTAFEVPFKNGFKLSQFLITLMFSVVISISIASIMELGRVLLRKTKDTPWKYWLYYYCLSIAGIIIATEVCFFLLSLLKDRPYSLTNHSSQLIFNLMITIIVTSISGSYDLLKGNLEAKVQQKEVEVLQLKQLKTQAELQALQSKINPHFLYNSLNSIACLIHEDSDKAEEMTLKLSRLFRYSINSGKENFSTIRDELEIVKNYLDIETVRFGNRIKFEVWAENNILSYAIPRFLIQPLVENALKHGLSDTLEDGQLIINLYKQSDYLIIKITDNGIPFPQELVAGYGLQSTYDKLKLLYQDNYEIRLINPPNKHVKIKIPILN